tara:strand:+ start:2110 stop:2406 length:297 start_codon:yes stop_codon:yes gene_type:complete
MENQFDLIREWANERGLIQKGDVKTQTLKLMEETGELAQSLLKDNRLGAIDAIGDIVVVLTNLAAIMEIDIEDCIAFAYQEIKNRQGKMVNGTFMKNN